MSRETAPQSYTPTPGERMYFALSRLMDRRNRHIQANDDIRLARDYEERATGYTDAQIPERGRAMMSAGQSYLNGGDFASAKRAFELSQPDMELAAHAGTFHSMAGLSRLYPAMEATYREIGDAEMAEAMRGKALAHDVAMEAAFGIKTQILPDGSRLVG